jgi:hypothetical protein
LRKIQISGAASSRNQEVVDVLSIRDLNTLCRIHEIRKEQIIALEEKSERWIKGRGELWKSKSETNTGAMSLPGRDGK